MKNKLNIIVLFLFSFITTQAQTYFSGQNIIIKPEVDGANFVRTADLDNDGDQDVLSTSVYDNKIAWYENLGSGIFGAQQVITNYVTGVQSIFCADLDGDGYLDVLSASSGDDKIAWYKNNGNGNFGTQQIITTEVDWARYVYAADLDGDGDQDAISASFNNYEVAWYENDGNGNFGVQQVITTDAGGVWSLCTADFDGDGDEDIVSACVVHDKIEWYENDGNGNFLSQQEVATSFDVARDVYTVDIDGDNDKDLVAASWGDDKVVWFENDGSGNFLSEHTITSSAEEVESVFAVDLDGDGDKDVLSASWADNKIAWYENDGSGNFGSQQVISTMLSQAKCVFAADMDNDGDYDVLSASVNDDKIAWHENDGTANFSEQKEISRNARSPESVFAADLDGDGNSDVLSASYADNKIAWYRNDGTGNFDVQQIINNSAEGASSVYAIDLDKDGDNDVLSASFNDNTIAWYENDGIGNFSLQQIISSSSAGAKSVFAADMDNDGDQDVLAASVYDNTVAWYENDGSGNFGSQQIITTSAEGAVSVFAIDLDGDGDNDVLSASMMDNMVAWYENSGNGSFSAQQIISTDAESVLSVYAADLDGDNDIDILSASPNDDKLAWYENDGSGNFGSQQIISTDVSGAYSVYANDIDGDNDMDILLASMLSDGVTWFENDGTGNFSALQLISSSNDDATSVFTADFDNDGDPDVLSSSSDQDKIVWYKNYTVKIISQPQDIDACPNSTINFTILTNDVDTFQWQVNNGIGFSDISDGGIYSGAETNTLTINNINSNMEGYSYRCVVSNYAGSLISDAATITIDATPPETPVLENILSECSVTVPPATTIDNCAGTIIGTTSDPTEYTEQGSYIITWIFNDENGNSTSAEQTVIISDETPPEIPILETLTGECSVTAITPSTVDNCAGTVIGTTSDPIEYTEQGTYIITWDFNDGNGNSSQAQQTIIVNDNTEPETPVLADISGECVDLSANIPTTLDNCSGTIYGTTSDPLIYTQNGNYVINWIFDDGNGNSITVQQNIVVNDLSSPEIPILADTLGECMDLTNYAPTTTDNCVGTIYGTTSDPLIYTQEGTYTITWNFDDGNGNSSQAQQTVIINDVTAPEIPVLDDITGECHLMVTAPTAADNCSGIITGTTSDMLEYSEQGTYIITWNFDDGNGNSSQAQQNIIINDITPPDAPSLDTLYGECGLTISTPSTIDNCAGEIFGVTTDPLEYTEQGTHSVSWVFDDGNGNSSSAQQIIIINDITPPETPLLSDLSDQCSVIAIPPTTNDNCEGVITATTNDETEYSQEGTYVINWIFDDGNGNSSTAQQNIIIDDTIAPETPILSNLTGECSLIANPPVTYDECVGLVYGTTNDPVEYNEPGVYSVNWYFDDGNGNSTMAQQSILVYDFTPPEAPILADTIAEYIDFSDYTPTTNDACAGIIQGTTADDLIYNQDGSYVITWAFNDGSGNSTTAQQNIIIDDVTAPETLLLDTLMGECNVVVTAPYTTDNSTEIIMGTTSDALEYSEQGTYTITWNFDDNNGNSSQAQQIVIIDDITPPETPVLATLSGECTVTANIPTSTDACEGIIHGSTTDPVEYNEPGAYTINWTFNDGNGNITTALQNIIVYDFTPPATPVLADTSGEYIDLTDYTPNTNDNCAGIVEGTTTDPLIYSQNGTYIITWTFNDGSGNSSTAQQNVIINDVTAPETPNLDDLNGECFVTATAPTTTDNSSGTIIGSTTDPLEYTEQGSYTITWTFDDGNGNSTTAEQTVIVEDITNPSLTCIGNINVNANETHFYLVQGTEFDPVEIYDNCEIANIVNDFNQNESLAETQLPEGITTINWTITDIAGNTNTCSFSVFVNEYNGIAAIDSKNIAIYPNPTTGIINFEFFENKVQNLIVYNLLGEKILEKEIKQNHEQIDLSPFTPGVYVISIKTDNKQFISRIVKK